MLKKVKHRKPRRKSKNYQKLEEEYEVVPYSRHNPGKIFKRAEFEDFKDFERDTKTKTICRGRTGEGQRCTRTVCDGPYCWQHSNDVPYYDEVQDALTRDFLEMANIAANDYKPKPYWYDDVEEL